MKAFIIFEMDLGNLKRIKSFLGLALIVGFYHYLWVFDAPLSVIYDTVSGQKATTVIDFENWKVLDFEELPQSEQFKYENPTCKSFSYTDSKFLKITWFDRYKNITGTTKAYQLLTPDRLIGNRIRIPNLSKTQYLLMDKKVLEIYQNLLQELLKKGFETDRIRITSALRNPTYNLMVNGASCSQHQLGTALDISVGDINGDGASDYKDRAEVYSILEYKLVKNDGGIGKYPNSPKLIHFDTRGKRARW